MRAGSVPHLPQMMATFASIIPALVPCDVQGLFPVAEPALLACGGVESGLEFLQRRQLVGRGVNVAASSRDSS